MKKKSVLAPGLKTLSFSLLFAVAALGKFLPNRWRHAFQRRQLNRKIRNNWTADVQHLPSLPTNARVNFMVAGTQKAGTSALIKLLGQHPRVSLPVIKEPHFFNNDGFFQSDNLPVEAYHTAFPDRGPNMVYGEGTTKTMFSPTCLDRVARYNPDMKLICILRDPVERAFSAWNMNHKRGDFRSFESLIEHEIRQIEQSGPVRDGFACYVSRGLYADQIRQLRKRFPEQQLKFIEYDHFKRHNREVLNECIRFLGLEPFELKADARKTNVYRYDSKIPPALENRLRALYLPEVVQVERLLGWDLSHWKGSEQH